MRYISASKALGHLGRLAAWQDGGRAAPVTVEWDLSNRCVLGCQDCHFAHTHVRGPWASLGPMPGYATTGDLADTGVVERGLREMADAGVQAVVFSGGGEPTTHPDWLRIVRAAAAAGLKVGMYTCGGLLDAQSAEKLALVAAWVVVSLDAADAETYSVDKSVNPDRFGVAVGSIGYLAVHESAVVGVSFLLHADNWHTVPQMLALARENRASYSTFRPVIRTSLEEPGVCLDDRGWITEAEGLLRDVALESDVELDWDRFLRYRDWAGRDYSTCYGVRLNATVTPDGRMWLCPQHRGLEHSLVGDLSVESFADVWDRHPGEWVDLSNCRVMCRLHLMNEVLDTVYQGHRHPEFV